MGRDLEAVKRIIDAFEDSDWETIDVRFGDVRVVLSTASPDRDEPTIGSNRRIEQDRPAPAETRDGPPPASVGDGAACDTPVEDEPGVVHVSSPSPGIFWRSPEPGAPPFVDIGTVVEPASTVCIVEIMKLMNHVKSGVSGRIVRVLAGNGEPVEKGTPLFAVAPDQPWIQD